MASSSRNNIWSSCLEGPIALDPRNFTALSRTPWAGSTLAGGIKRSQAQAPDQLIGESWEVSCDPEAPSRLEHDRNVTLAELIQYAPQEMLSHSLVESGRTYNDILIKLLNANSPLSLQIHPADMHPALKPNECGKPESWLVLDAKPGSGLYLGFSKTMTVHDIESALKNGTFSEKNLHFVSVKKGDFFEIEPGVPHAIGPGVVLLEPQRIMPNKSGKTWRMWDWNRKYNSKGELDMMEGSPRELHIDQAITLLKPESQVGVPYEQSLRRLAEIDNPCSGTEVWRYPANFFYQVFLVRMQMGSRICLTDQSGFAAVTMLNGVLTTTSRLHKSSTMSPGESYFIPANALDLTVTPASSACEFTVVIPAGQGTQKHGGLIFRKA